MLNVIYYPFFHVKRTDFILKWPTIPLVDLSLFFFFFFNIYFSNLLDIFSHREGFFYFFILNKFVKGRRKLLEKSLKILNSHIWV